MDIKVYSITDVKHWMFDNSSNVDLPAIQRGFVWRPYQIEILWDSLFRGFPMVSFMFTSTGKKFMLLDGQQRATSIALGFYNPWKAYVDKLGNAKNLPVVWLDLFPQSHTDNSEFVFRVVTRSHPWGYQAVNNNKVLSVPDRIAASENYKRLFSVEMYTKLTPDQRLPFDAALPIPLCYLLEAYDSEYDYGHWRQELIKLCAAIPEDYHPKHLQANVSYHAALEDCDLTYVFEKISNLLSNYRIPAITIPNGLILRSADNATVNPTLFVRLNSGGTNLEGDELIYSIYKAVCPLTKDLVESVSNNIISPAKIISLTSRLVLSNIYNRYYKNISLGQFQREIGTDTFRDALETFIGTTSASTLAKLIAKSISILRYDGTFPDVVIKKFIKDAPNAFMLLLNWLYHNDEDVSTSLAKKICARLYINYWFGDLDYLVQETWIQSAKREYWDEPYQNTRYYIQRPLVDPDTLEAFFNFRVINPVEDFSISADEKRIWDQWTAAYHQPETMKDEDYVQTIKDTWNNFVWRLLGNKTLILIAQRDYINRTFKDFNQLEDLQDTETPWDWDHIYPNSWVYGRWYIDGRTKAWEARIGNFRAMSLTDNRSENNNLSPAERFTEPNADYFIKENDLLYWSQLTQGHRNITDGDEKYILIHAKAIITRTVNIYREIYELMAPYL